MSRAETPNQFTSYMDHDEGGDTASALQVDDDIRGAEVGKLNQLCIYCTFIFATF